MLLQILLRAPQWLYGLFAMLLTLGLQQMFTRQAGLTRATLLPLAMIGLSVYSVASVFGVSPLALLGRADGVAAAAALTLCLSLPEGLRYDGKAHRFTVPGSAAPLALMMSTFRTKYAASVSLALRAPGWPAVAFRGWPWTALQQPPSAMFLARVACACGV